MSFDVLHDPGARSAVLQKAAEIDGVSTDGLSDDGRRYVDNLRLALFDTSLYGDAERLSEHLQKRLELHKKINGQGEISEIWKRLESASDSGSVASAAYAESINADRFVREQTFGVAHGKRMEHDHRILKSLFGRDLLNPPTVDELSNAFIAFQENPPLADVRRAFSLLQSEMIKHAHNPRALAEVSEHPAALTDEMMVMLGRQDLLPSYKEFRDKINKDDAGHYQRTRVLPDGQVERHFRMPDLSKQSGDEALQRAELFREMVDTKFGLGSKASPEQKIRHFAELVEAGKQVSHNPLSVVAFNRACGGTSSHAASIGLEAMRDLRDTQTVRAAFFERALTPDVCVQHGYSSSTEDKKKLVSEILADPKKTFEFAYSRFLEHEKTGSPEISRSFALMRSSARDLLDDENAIRSMNIHVAQALTVFSPEEEKQRLNIQEDFENKLHTRLESQGKVVTKSDLLSVDSEIRYGVETLDKVLVDEENKVLDPQKSAGKKVHQVDFGSAKAVSSELAYQVLDGGRIRIAKSQEDLESGENTAIFNLSGVRMPAFGQKGVDGETDIGIEATAKMEALLARFDKGNIQFVFQGQKPGEVQVLLPHREDLGMALLRSGHALNNSEPDDPLYQARKSLQKGAERANRGISRDGGWPDKLVRPSENPTALRARVVEESKKSLVSNATGVSRKLQDEDLQLFAVSLGSRGLDLMRREAERAVAADPERMYAIYRRNMREVKGLRAKEAEFEKKSEFLDPSKKLHLKMVEQTTHDELVFGARLLGDALVKYGEEINPQTGRRTYKYVDPVKHKEDTEKLMTKDAKDRSDWFRKSLLKAGDATEASVKFVGSKAKEIVEGLMKATEAMAGPGGIRE